jgi:long-chain acyl-CoA synthetase
MGHLRDARSGGEGKDDEVSTRAELDEAARGRTVCSVFLGTAATHGGRTALRERDGDGWRTLTYAGLADQVARVAGGLRTLGLRPGDRVILMLRNRIAFTVADLAVLFAGGTPVSIYNTSSAEQVAWLAGHCRASFAILDGPHEHDLFEEAAPTLPHLGPRIVVDHTAEHPDAWSSLLAADPIDLAEAASAVEPDHLATVIYTSGTTGPPKGVMLSHANVVWTLESQRRAFDRRSPGFRTVSYLPMAHIAERMVSHYEAVATAYEVTCCPDVAELGAFVAASRPQLLFGVPRVWEKIRSGVEAALAGDPERTVRFRAATAAALPLRLAALRGALSAEDQARLDTLDAAVFRDLRTRIGLDDCSLPICSAAPIPKGVLEWFIAIGVPLFEVYGMSELTGPLTCNVTGRQPGTVGLPMPGCEVRLADDGEVLGRGGNVFAGYLDDPVRTAETVDADGWLHTGDLGVLDGDGRLRIVDRKKELFITSGGENISPANLEAALRSIALVGQACALGDGRPYPTALLVLDPDAATAWANDHDRADATLRELASDPDLVAELGVAVEDVMAPFGRAERVKRFLVLPDAWTADSDLLTPTLKLKRRAVLARYATEIDDLYRSL